MDLLNKENEISKLNYEKRNMKLNYENIYLFIRESL